MKPIKKDLLKEKLLLEKELKKLYEKQKELKETCKKLIKHGSTTKYIKPQKLMRTIIK